MEGLWFIFMCVWFLHFHAPTPALIVLQKSLKWINFSGSGCWIMAHVHVVCDYCSVTPDADPGLHAVPHVCEECGHVLSGRFLNFNTQHTFIFSLCCFLDHLWHHGIVQHHSKQLTSFLFLITSAFCVKTPPSTPDHKPLSVRCGIWSICKMLLFPILWVPFLLDLLLCVCC